MSYTGALEIPATVTYEGRTYNVVSVGEQAFKGANITSLTIPEGVVTIGVSAFTDNEELTGSLILPSSLKEVQNGAFSQTGITGILFGGTTRAASALETIGAGAFNLTKITELTIPSSVTGIGNQAFAGCSELATVSFDAGSHLSTISQGVFRNCPKLTKVVLPSTVTEIGEYAFAGTALTYAPLHEGMTKLDTGAFANCTSMTSAQIPTSLTEMADAIFSGCTKLSDVVFAEDSQLRKIGIVQQTDPEIEIEGAFANCTSLISVTIPSSVTVIGSKTFAGCTNMRTITIESDSLDTLAAHAFKDVPKTVKFIVRSNAVKDALKQQGLVDETQIHVSPSGESESALTLTTLEDGGLGKQVKVTITDPNTRNYILVQITNENNSNSIYTVPAPASGEMTISYAKGNTVQVWLTETMPELVGGTPSGGGAILGHAEL